jgi:hypothetical protein
MKRKFHLCIFLPLTLAFVSCGLAGYNDLGEAINPYLQLGAESKTYMRTESAVGGDAVELITLSDPDEENRGGIIIMEIIDETTLFTVKISRGTYELAGGSIAIDIFVEYENAYKPTSNPSGNPGASQTEFSPDKRIEFAFVQEDVQATIALDGTLYKRVDLILDSILAKSSPDREEQLMKMYDLTIVASQSKIDGFGGKGMLGYIGKTTLVEGFRFGSFDLRPNWKGVPLFSSVITEFHYDKYSDNSYVVLTGKQSSEASMGGNGSMSGTVSFTLQGSATNWSCSVDYGNIVLSETLGSAGFYEVTIQGTPYTVSFEHVNPGFFSFTDILDPDPLKWTF